MAVDTRKAKWKEKDKNGNEVILRDAKLVEQTTETTIADTDCFELSDADGNLIKIPCANVYSIIDKAIAKLAAGNNKGSVSSGIRVPVIQGTGDNADLGSDSVSDFKKLVGAEISTKVIDPNTNLDDLGNQGVCLYWNGSYFILNSGLVGAVVSQWRFAVGQPNVQVRTRTDWLSWNAWSNI